MSWRRYQDDLVRITGWALFDIVPGVLFISLVHVPEQNVASFLAVPTIKKDSQELLIE